MPKARAEISLLSLKAAEQALLVEAVVSRVKMFCQEQPLT